MKTAIFLTVAVLIAVAESYPSYKYYQYERNAKDCHGYYSGDSFCDGKESGLYTNDNDCTCFYQCYKNHPVTYIKPCAVGTIWCQVAQTCVHGVVQHRGHAKPRCWNKDNACISVSPGPTTTPRPPTDCNQYTISDDFCTTNDIAKQSIASCIASHKNKYGDHYEQYHHNCFYFEYKPDCSCFYQCNPQGRTFIRPCAPRTRWDQSQLTCVHDNGSCKSVYGK